MSKTDASLAMRKLEGYQAFILEVTGVTLAELKPAGLTEMLPIGSALMTLGTNQRGRSHLEVVILRYGLDGFGVRTIREIAEKYGVSKDAITNQIKAVIRAMREWPRSEAFAAVINVESPLLMKGSEDSIYLLKELPRKWRRALWEGDIRTISQLVESSDRCLLDLGRIGEKGLRIIDEALKAMGKTRKRKQGVNA